MLGFGLDFWDYATFATAALAGGVCILIHSWIAGLPGRIALRAEVQVPGGRFDAAPAVTMPGPVASGQE